MTVTISGTTGISRVQDGAVTPAATEVGAQPSMIKLRNANGYGSTNNKIRRFTDEDVNQGSDITYVDSDTLGASFTINTDGTYAISYSDQFNTAGVAAISLNSSQLTTAASGTSDNSILSSNTSDSANRSVNPNWAGFLSSGDVIRPHTEGNISGVNTVFEVFTIVRIA